MKLRAELLPPELDSHKVKLMTELASEVIDRMDSGLNYDEQVKAFNQMAQRPYEGHHFDGAMGSIGMEEFARQALLPDAPIVETVSDDEYLEILRRIMNCEYQESEMEYWLQFLDKNLKYPDLSDYIFWAELSPEQILVKVRSYNVTNEL